ncbi:hypothetical protein DFJ63DRAFT_315461 [Scheffersomyces coipomensis]|uniref:uncharacterized protein n=1 Tax=Scheffersomyces coipomensis TaxID=1788519 RepID=UPI00315C82B6
MGRVKIEIKKIVDSKKRKVCFGKRSNGLFKKARELSILTGKKIAIIVLGDDENDVHTYTSGNLKSILEDYMTRTGIQTEIRTSEVKIEDDSNDEIESEAEASEVESSDNDDDGVDEDAIDSIAATAATVAFAIEDEEIEDADDEADIEGEMENDMETDTGNTNQGVFSPSTDFNDLAKFIDTTTQFNNFNRSLDSESIKKANEMFDQMFKFDLESVNKNEMEEKSHFDDSEILKLPASNNAEGLYFERIHMNFNGKVV